MRLTADAFRKALSILSPWENPLREVMMDWLGGVPNKITAARLQLSPGRVSQLRAEGFKLLIEKLAEDRDLRRQWENPDDEQGGESG